MMALTSSPSASSSSSLSWSWLSHQKHEQQKQQQQQQQQQQPQQPQDCQSKSEVIAAAAACGCHMAEGASAVIYGQQPNSTGNSTACLKGQLIDLCGGGDDDEGNNYSQSATNRQSVSCTSLEGEGEGKRCCCCCYCLVRLGGSSRFARPTAEAAAATLRHSRDRSSSALSSWSSSMSAIIAAGDGAQQTRTSPIQANKTTREHQTSASSTAINNAINCDRWQQISCFFCSSNSTSSSSTLLARQQSLVARSDHQQRKHHHHHHHHPSYYQTTNNSTASNNLIANNNNSNNRRVASFGGDEQQQHLKSSSSIRQEQQQQRQVRQRQPPLSRGKSCDSLGAQTGRSHQVGLITDSRLIGGKEKAARESIAQYNDACSLDERATTKKKSPSEFCPELPLATQLASTIVCLPSKNRECPPFFIDGGGGGEGTTNHHSRRLLKIHHHHHKERREENNNSNNNNNKETEERGAHVEQQGQQATPSSSSSSSSPIEGCSIEDGSIDNSEVMEIKREQQHQHQQHLSLDLNLKKKKKIKNVCDVDELVPNYHHHNYYQEQTTVNYPNNTLIVDLIKCHRNIANVWPLSSGLGSGLANLKSACNRPRQPQHGTVKKFNKCNRFNFQMPEQLERTNIRLKSDVYDKALSVLTSDIRYQLHLLLYRRIQTIWLLLSTIFCMVLPVVLVANLELLIVLGAFCFWLSLQLLGAFLTKQFRIKLDQMLEKSVAQVNSYFMEHNLMLGVINVGSLTRKAKLNIPMVYFDTSQCREQIESIISIPGSPKRGRGGGKGKSNDDCNSNDNQSGSGNSSDIINNNNNNNIGGDNFFLDYSKLGEQPTIHQQYQSTTTTPTRPNNVAIAFAQTQMAKKILLRYSQRWISQYDKRKLMFADNLEPRHLSTGKCLCQFIEEQLNTDNNNNNNNNDQDNNQTTKNVTSPFQGRSSSSSQKRQVAARFERFDDCGRVVIDVGCEPEMRARKVVGQQQQQHPKIPTLSRLVSLRHNTTDQDNGDHQGANMFAFNRQSGGANNYNSAQSSSIGDDESRGEPSEVDLQSTARDISLELGDDSIGRSDDLVKRLRLLLELRKYDLQGIGGSLFADLHSKTPQFLSNSTGYTTADSLTIDSSHEPPSPLPPPVDRNVKSSASGKGKKFFRQRDGFFLLGMLGAKRSQHQHQQQNQQSPQQQDPQLRDRILEIC